VKELSPVLVGLCRSNSPLWKHAKEHRTLASHETWTISDAEHGKCCDPCIQLYKFDESGIITIIVHETIHHVLAYRESFDTCVKFDNIAGNTDKMNALFSEEWELLTILGDVTIVTKVVSRI